MVRRRRAAQHNGGNMKTLFAAVLLAVTFAGFGAANAAGGCGLGYHRGPYGGGRPQRWRRRGCSPGRASDRGGAARPRLPLRLRLALWTLPRVLRGERIL